MAVYTTSVHDIEDLIYRIIAGFEIIRCLKQYVIQWEDERKRVLWLKFVSLYLINCWKFSLLSNYCYMKIVNLHWFTVNTTTTWSSKIYWKILSKIDYIWRIFFLNSVLSPQISIGLCTISKRIKRQDFLNTEWSGFLTK